MKILDILTAPWAIEPSKLIELQAIYATHMRGEKIDVSAVEARIGKPLKNEPQGYQVIDGVAVVPINGVTAKRMNLFAEISGGASTELIGRDLRAALNDPTVKSIMLHIDSPGGTVDGTQTLAQLVESIGQQKPVVAFADGMMASAAYWIGSAASAVYVSSETTQVGSIGVVATHTDVSGAQAQQGVKTTEISAGKYKRIASQYGPLTDEGKAAIQEQVDTLYTIFVNDVARHRSASAEAVLEHMADGRVFLGAEAVQRGLVDGIASMETMLSRMASGDLPMMKKKPRDMAGAAMPATPISAGAVLSSTETEQGDIPMDIETLRADHPQLVEALVAEGFEAGTAAERQRIADIEAQALPGHEALISQLKADGKSTGADAAKAVLAAERELRASHLANLHADAPQLVPHAPAPDDAAAIAAEAALPLDDRCKAKWERDEGLRAEFNGNYDSYLAFEKAQAAGKVRVLSGRGK